MGLNGIWWGYNRLYNDSWDMYTIIWDYTSITHITTRFCLKISVNTIRFFIIWLTLPFGDLLQIDFGSCVWAVKMTVDLLNKQGIPTNNNYWLWEILTFWSGILQQNKFNPQTSSNLLRNLGFPWISGGNLNGAAVALGAPVAVVVGSPRRHGVDVRPGDLRNFGVAVLPAWRRIWGTCYGHQMLNWT